MNIIIISNDRYFSCGFIDIMQDSGYQCKYSDFSNLTSRGLRNLSANYDLVALDISYVQNINEFLAASYGIKNIFLLIDISTNFIKEGAQFISKRESKNNILRKTQQYLYFKRERIKYNEFKMLKYHAEGLNISTIALKLKINDKSVYRLRNSLVLKLGFRRYHPLTAICCEKLSSFLWSDTKA
ncbi:TPA: hypothetical protein SML19_002396 [Klebsiella oxytoca]|jgi:DNA-binding CsgD family transcriptional regulator|uniref:hypothetical protein n=1 Tax=Klebsiella oxytoca TaxID=571 RepID=UPI0013D274F4|nr:hypothetical protein [Klebsiella oxytoca]EIX9036625.1 hypothetical protein [Klebsiella oxytoca]EKU2380863.1 hypothetical protein [Klebsiella oxytoca]EKY0605611.1 hypothetical protein [Klebsiella oxytoca]HEI8593620.1 hypothetical protein [Klebsiella oxytoca]HEJ0074474.1 hypothetical protein [Klebsiella oxytoca]